MKYLKKFESVDVNSITTTYIQDCLLELIECNVISEEIDYCFDTIKMKILKKFKININKNISKESDISNFVNFLEDINVLIKRINELPNSNLNLNLSTNSMKIEISIPRNERFNKLHQLFYNKNKKIGNSNIFWWNDGGTYADQNKETAKILCVDVKDLIVDESDSLEINKLTKNKLYYVIEMEVKIDNEDLSPTIEVTGLTWRDIGIINNVKGIKDNLIEEFKKIGFNLVHTYEDNRELENYGHPFYFIFE